MWRHDSNQISRRRLLGGTGALLAAALTGCTGGGQLSQKSGGSGGALQWWDQFRPLTKMLQNDLFAPYMQATPGVTIERRQMDGPDLGQALQVARRSNQMPDVHSLAGLGGVSPAALVSEGWFQPIGKLAGFAGSPVGGQLYDGVHRFNGEIYSFAPFSGRWHDAVPWFNTALLKEAGVDPEEEPGTWDKLREIARRVTKGTDGDVYGMVVPTKDTEYLSALVHRLAMSAGAPGPGAVDWATGEYVYDSQPYIDAIEFLASLQKDKVVHPASASMGPRDARARWAAGQAAVYLWGAWFIGGLRVDEPEAVERGVGTWHIPCPETTRNFIYNAPMAGTFWVSNQSKKAKTAAEVLLRMTTKEFQAKLAAAMDQPPALAEAVERSDAHPTYKKCVANFQDDVRIGPIPEAGTPGVWQALAEMRDIHPNLGDIVQSVLTGASTDVGGQLRRFKDQLSAERERAVKAVREKGAEVDLNAWVFANWDREADYDQKSYAGR
ncbi:ABC-type glycerol-3-phosphate transport system, substrate-binding protein [Nonomuraea solani]|uniref:ABC-type glycerol-3-phosphate transport system, substrate-binding protein n=1 Tax=Nonomuraea solani TaxID=1144553 RepID=A0A1H6EQ29_9ACTN|nr:extracellular solute-binding protein [Nonomuraea solani]SEG99980.1 ABC-type glycerol-3-phosphate transport system, substrate-binding protein [Nonomuraea solani]